MQFGHAGKSSRNDTENFSVAKIFVDPKANGPTSPTAGNKSSYRRDAGRKSRYWGRTAASPTTPTRQIRSRGSARSSTPVHCAELAHDGLVYVCDRANDRIQVFRRTASS
jgi:hypothetical protein